MPMTKAEVNSSVADLSPEEQVEIAEAVYSRLEDDMPLPEWQKKLLDERNAYTDAHPEDGRPWSEVKASLRASLNSV